MIVASYATVAYGDLNLRDKEAAQQAARTRVKPEEIENASTNPAANQSQETRAWADLKKKWNDFYNAAKENAAEIIKERAEQAIRNAPTK